LNFRPTWDLRGGSGESEPVGGNYYPTTAAAYIKDSSRDTQLTVLTDRAQAAASLQNGQLEFMVHRRLVADDSRGVGEPLNETVGGMSPYPTWERSGDGIIVSGKHYVLVSNTNDALRETRELMDKIYQPLKPSYALKKQDSDVSTMAIKSVAPLAFDLPANVQLMTFQTWAQNILLVRLAHQFALDEDASLSAPVTIDVGALLASFNPGRNLFLRKM
jgi:Glycosyl hydrolases family 38 C-terminal domain